MLDDRASRRRQLGLGGRRGLRHAAGQAGVMALLATWSGCGQHIDRGDATAADAGARSIALVYHDAVVEVALRPSGDGEAGSRRTTLDLVVAPVAGTLLESLAADFVADDGFMPAQSPNCRALVPVHGALLSQGSIDVDTRDLTWDAALGYPGCMSVRNTAEIRLTDP